MPTYEYRCPACKAEYELREGFDAAPSHKCQQCRKGTAKRVLRAPAIVFKGGGFYATDSRRSAGASSDSADSKDGGSVEKAAPATSVPSGKADAPASEKGSPGDGGSPGAGHSHGPGGHSHD